MNKKQIAVVALALWLVGIGIFMLFEHYFNFEIFFILGFLGFLGIAEFLRPRHIQPGVLRYFTYLVAAGSIIFGALVIRVVLNILFK